MGREAVGEEEFWGGSVADDESFRMSIQQRDFPGEKGMDLAWSHE